MLKLGFAALLVTTVHFAAADDTSPPQRPPHGPPPEAIAACANAKQADTCSFTIHDHTIDGTCQPRPDNTTELACRPDHPPPRPGGDDKGPPPPPPPESTGSDGPS